MYKNNYTYNDLANILGHSKPFIWQIVNGKRRLSYKKAIQLSAVFDLKPDDIFYSTFKNDEEIKESIKNIKNNRNKIIKGNFLTK